MEHGLWGVLLKPFIGLFFLCLPIPLVLAFRRWFPDGRVKRFLLRPVPGGKPRAAK